MSDRGTPSPVLESGEEDDDDEYPLSDPPSPRDSAVLDSGSSAFTLNLEASQKSVGSTLHGINESFSGQLVPVTVEMVGGRHVSFSLDPSLALGQQVEAVHAKLSEEEELERPFGEMTLMSAKTREFLTALEWDEDAMPAWLTAGAELLYVVSPAAQVTELIEALKSMDRESRKRTVFQLKGQLHSAQFSEEFIAQDGITTLLGILDEYGEEGGALLAYSLNALRQAMCWQLGMDQFCDSDENVQRLFSVLYYDHLKSTARALELLTVVCTVAEEDSIFGRVLAAAARCGRANDDPPFYILIRHLRCDDLDVKLNSLTLINALISAAEVGHERERLVFMLDRLRCNAVLMANLEVKDDLFQTQLDVYAGLTHHIDLPGSWYEADFYKGKAQQLALELEDARRSLGHYRVQQPLVALLRADLLRATQLLESSAALGVPVPHPDALERDHHEEEELPSITAIARLASPEAVAQAHPPHPPHMGMASS